MQLRPAISQHRIYVRVRMRVLRRYRCLLRGITHLLLVAHRRIKSSRLWVWA